ncbi:MAG: HAMP domain-containing protein [Candidatus Omnitrophica bacterium]|nr:HAMP domain-containing protein [Candidatus Omnitrophota bacterium]
MIKRWINAGLQFKFLSIVLAVLFFFALTVSVIITHNEVGLWKKSLQDKAKSVGAYVADISKDPLLYKNYVQLDNIVDKINNDPEIVYAIIYDSEHKPLTSFFASFNFRKPLVKKLMERNDRPSDINGMVVLLQRQKMIDQITIPIIIDDEAFGQVVVGISEEMMFLSVQRTVKGILLANGIAMLLAAFLLFQLQRFIIDPIVDLSHLIANISKKKNYTLRAKVHANDEVGFLANAFNDMLEQVMLHNELLEKEVIRRTESLKLAQQKLIESEKMASIGQLAAGIAHEINNPMAFIISNMDTLRAYLLAIDGVLRGYEFLEVYLKDNDIAGARACVGKIHEMREAVKFAALEADLYPLVDETKSGALRVSKIISDLKLFARATMFNNEYLDVHDVIEVSINMVNSEFKYKGDLVREYGILPKILANAQELGNVFRNILLNAAQAIQDKGRISVRTFLKDGHVVVEIMDNGTGIPPEVRAHIFEPFFTTKDVGVGTGLGLSIAYGIIRKYNGKILVVSAPGHGTTFAVHIPTEVALT